MPMFHIQPVNTSAMKTGNVTRPTLPSTMLAIDRPRPSLIRAPFAPTTIAMMLPASMTPCAPKVWNAIRPFATFWFDPWKRPTSETPTCGDDREGDDADGSGALAEVEH